MMFVCVCGWGAGKGGKGGDGGKVYQKSVTNQAGAFNSGRTAPLLYAHSAVLDLLPGRCAHPGTHVPSKPPCLACMQRAQRRRELPMVALEVLA